MAIHEVVLREGSAACHLIGRLRPGVTTSQVREDVTRIAEQLKGENPVWKPGEDYAEGITVTLLRERLVADSRQLLYLLFGAVGLVLLLACANVANLQVVRGAARERELTIRTTLGAGGGRLARQLITEGLVLAMMGGVAGLIVAVLAMQTILGLLPADIPRLADVRLDGMSVAFTLLITMLTGLAFGVLPARRVAREQPATGSGARATAGQRQRRLAGVLVSAQIAIALVLVVGAGLLVRSLSRLLDIIMMHAHLECARALVVTAPDETTATLVVTTARDLSPQLPIIARAATEQGVHELAELGAQYVVHPELEGGLELIHHTLLSLGFPLREVHEYAEAVRRDRYNTNITADEEYQSLNDLLHATKGIEIFWLQLSAASSLVGRTLAEVNIRSRSGASVVVLIRNQQLLANPKSMTVL